MAFLKAGRPSGRTQDHVAEQSKRLDEEARLNIIMNKQDYKALKLYAAHKDLSITEVVKKALAEYMSKNP